MALQLQPSGVPLLGEDGSLSGVSQQIGHIRRNRAFFKSNLVTETQTSSNAVDMMEAYGSYIVVLRFCQFPIFVAPISQLSKGWVSEHL